GHRILSWSYALGRARVKDRKQGSRMPGLFMARRRSGALDGASAHYVDCYVFLCIPLPGMPKLRLSEARKTAAIQEPVRNCRARGRGNANSITTSGALITIYSK